MADFLWSFIVYQSTLQSMCNFFIVLCSLWPTLFRSLQSISKHSSLWLTFCSFFCSLLQSSSKLCRLYLILQFTSNLLQFVSVNSSFRLCNFLFGQISHNTIIVPPALPFLNSPQWEYFKTLIKQIWEATVQSYNVHF